MNPYYPCSRHKLTNYEINWLHSFADLRKKMKESRAKNWKFSNNLKVTFRIIARVQIMVHNNVSSINSIKLRLTYISVISSGLLLCHVKLTLKKYKLKNMCTFVCKSSKVITIKLFKEFESNKIFPDNMSQLSSFVWKRV